MEKTRFYAITVRKFNVLTRHLDWMKKTQEFYNEILGFYYNLYLDVFSGKKCKDPLGVQTESQDSASSSRSTDRLASSMDMLRELEKLTIVGRGKKPVPYPIPWEKVPLYFRRAAINGAVAAARSYLSRNENDGSYTPLQKARTAAFSEAVTFYKGMYRDFSEKEIFLKLWDGARWHWSRCRLRSNTAPSEGQMMSPALVLKKNGAELHIPWKMPVPDGRNARERIEAEDKICSVVFTNKDAALVCCIVDADGNKESCFFLKGGKEYAHRCRELLEKIEKSRQSAGGGDNPYANGRYWEKLKNLNDHYSHHFSRQVIDYCVKHGAKILVLPDFENNHIKYIMKQSGKFSPIQLSISIRKKLKYKAWQAGIVVLETQQHHISSVCAECGGKVKNSGSSFHCENGHQGNRYLNSAWNLGKKCRESFASGKAAPGNTNNPEKTDPEIMKQKKTGG